MERDARLRRALAVALFATLLVAIGRAEYFGHEVVTEIAVFAILAMSLDLVAGYAGMVSLAHGALFGLGAYLYALLSARWGLPSGVAIVGGSVFAGLSALAVGAAVCRVHGIFFIMATLAIGEMGYEFFFKSNAFGGDDGFAGIPRPDLGAFGIDLAEPSSFAMLAVVAAIVVYLVLGWMLASPWGLTLVGIQQNERRMRALGLPTYRYKAVAMGVSGIFAGFAGTLSAMHSQFITPQLLSWMSSGEVLVMIILGGLGTLVGAVIGAALVIGFKRYDLCPLALPPVDARGWCPSPDFWHFWLGLLLIAVVLSRGNGVVGVLEASLRRSLASRGAGDAAR